MTIRPYTFLVLDGRAWSFTDDPGDDVSVYVAANTAAEARRWIHTTFHDGRIQRFRFIRVNPITMTPEYEHDGWEDSTRRMKAARKGAKR